MPPKIHMRPLKETTPAANRGDQPAARVAGVQLAPSTDDQTSWLASCPGRRPLYQPPISHILSSCTTVIARSLCFQGAWAVTRVQFLPSAELHTLRGGDSYEFQNPQAIVVHDFALRIAGLPDGCGRHWLPIELLAIAVRRHRVQFRRCALGRRRADERKQQDDGSHELTSTHVLIDLRQRSFAGWIVPAARPDSRESAYELSRFLWNSRGRPDYDWLLTCGDLPPDIPSQMTADDSKGAVAAFPFFLTLSLLLPVYSRLSSRPIISPHLSD